MRSKFNAVILILALMIFLFTGILFKGCSVSNKQPSTDTTIELEFWTLQMLGFSDYIEEIIAEYESNHPGIKIKWVDVPFSEGEKKALTSMLAKHTPDVINLNPDFSAVLANRSALLNMNEWVDPVQKSSYLPVSWDAASLGVHAFGLPWYLTSSVTLYNKELLRFTSFDSPPKTYEEMAEMAQILKTKSDNYLLMPILSEGGRFFRFLKKRGIKIGDFSHKFVFADSGAGIELRFWVDMYRKNLIPKESIIEGQQSAVDRYQSGTLAMLLTGPNFLNIVKENSPQVFKATDVAPQFPAKSDFMDFSEMILVVPKRTSHPREAVDFALFVTNPQNTFKLSELAPVLPPHGKILNSDIFKQIDSSDLLVKARSISAQQMLGAKTSIPINPLQNRLNQIMDFYVQSALLEKLSPEEAMRKAQQEMNKLIQ